MKTILRPAGVLTLAWLAWASPAAALSEAEEALFAAAKKGAGARLAMGLSEVDPNLRDASGKTLLMTAAEAGHFGTLQALLWGGADARLKTKDGKVAKDFLDLESKEYVENNLLLRCYAFVQSETRVNPKRVKFPSVVGVSDNYVDYNHPRLKGHYHINAKEKNGKPGVDDDGNGFTDDTYGWNFAHEQPPKAPQLAIDRSPETMKFLKTLLAEVAALRLEEDEAKANAMLAMLQHRAINPLIQQVGAETFAKVGFLLDDAKYYDMWMAASHGTHVAGIIVEESGGVAKVTSATHGIYRSRKVSVLMNAPGTIKCAEEAESYEDYLKKVIEIAREYAFTKGQRASGYLKQLGAGVVNMSWGKPIQVYRETADQFRGLYEVHGKNPDTIEDLKPVSGIDQIENLALELAVADAALFATIFHENPDVLFVLAAGNESDDNDVVLPSPGYLSRFFPNVITVASVSPAGRISEFSNWGAKSVQIAAMGQQVVSGVLADLDAPMDGTSMAAPKVAGVAARIRAENPKLRAAEVRRILEQSARSVWRLKGKLVTGGELDSSEALKLGKSWSSKNAAQLVAKRKAPAEKPRALPSLMERPKEGAKPQPERRITSVAGRSGSWRVVMSDGTPFKVQSQSGVGAYPSEWIEKQWGEGLRITGLSGAGERWNVTMSDGVPGYQSVVGFDFDQTQVKQSMDEGRRITAVGGWKNRWLVVLSTETGWGEQRYTLPTPLSKDRRKWIDERWAEGYRITSVAGDDDPKVDDDGWLIVMTKATGIQAQSILGPGEWPWQKILAKQREGKVLTTLAGGPGRWVVVMSEGSKWRDQVFSQEGKYPVEWVGDRWAGRLPKK